jgi:hypothetical protein
MTRRFLLLSALMTTTACAQTQVWTDAERKEIQKYWMTQGRYNAVSQPTYVVRLTTDGSLWLWEYNRKRGKSKGPPSQVPTAANEEEAAWEKWIDTKVAFDRYNAGVEAARRSNTSYAAVVVSDPGRAPLDLVEKFGEPPRFANAVQPINHTVRFDDVTLNYQDNVDMRPRYAYYRFEDGVMAAGTRMKSLPSSEVDSVLVAAGITESEARVLKAVSLLEGGFDSVNTYDTGFVSVGFIQFASLKDGSHSLGQTLLQYKRDDPAAFADDFRRFGVEVDANGNMIALDATCLVERVGADANRQIIRDKWLIGAFQRAGQRTPYRLAQLRVAKRMYWPLGDSVTVKFGGKDTTFTLGQIFRSEAGTAVLLDRKVNTGGYGPLRDVLQAAIEAKGLRTLEDLQRYEALFVECLWYRYNPSKDDTLAKPKECEMVATVVKRFRGR